METTSNIDYISTIINLLLLIANLFTVIYAGKTLLMNHSSQIVITHAHQNKDEFSRVWKVTISNYGNGHLVKAFILVTYQQKRFKNKTYFLSKPEANLESGSTKQLKLELKEEHLKNIDFALDNQKIEVIYQDAMGNIFVTKQDVFNDEHLRKFDTVPKKLGFFKKYLYKQKFKQAHKQKNTFPDFLSDEKKEELKKMEKELNQ